MITFPDAIKAGFQKYTDFKTRSTRAEFWWWVLFVMLAGIMLGILDAVIFGGEETDPTPLSTLFNLATLIPGIAVTARRLHDVGRSGWWMLIGLTGIGFFFPLLYWYVKKGDEGANEYGSDPFNPSKPSPEDEMFAVKKED